MFNYNTERKNLQEKFYRFLETFVKLHLLIKIAIMRI